jgi:hypothetical protein
MLVTKEICFFSAHPYVLLISKHVPFQQRLDVSPEQCLVVEDSIIGLQVRPSVPCPKIIIE